MTKAEEKAIEIYPDNSTYGNKIVSMKRECFIEGYNQAIKEIHKEMYDWIDKNLKTYISYCEQSE